MKILMKILVAVVIIFSAITTVAEKNASVSVGGGIGTSHEYGFGVGVGLGLDPQGSMAGLTPITIGKSWTAGLGVGYRIPLLRSFSFSIGGGVSYSLCEKSVSPVLGVVFGWTPTRAKVSGRGRGWGVGLGIGYSDKYSYSGSGGRRSSPQPEPTPPTTTRRTPPSSPSPPEVETKGEEKEEPTPPGVITH